MPGKGALTLTGKLGDVMKESAQAASLVRSHPADYGISDDVFKNLTCISTCPRVVSQRMVPLQDHDDNRTDFASCGHQGSSGCRHDGDYPQKCARGWWYQREGPCGEACGVKTIIMPKRCEDLHEIPENNLEGIEFIFAQKIEEVLAAALQSKPKPAKKDPTKDVFTVFVSEHRSLS